jgi:hypothetical protein
MSFDISHPFVNPKSDGSDNTKTRPSDWNAKHTARLNGRVVTGTTDTVVATDDNAVIRYYGGTQCTVTLPASLPVDFNVTLVQCGAGQVAFTYGSGATGSVRPTGGTKTAGKGAQMGAMVVSQNSGGSTASGATGTTAE